MGTEIKTGRVVEPKIYAYTTPQVTTNDGWIKIGYTERDVETRIREQTHTAAIQTEILWNHLAEYVDGPEKGLNFKDHDFHRKQSGFISMVHRRNRKVYLTSLFIMIYQVINLGKVMNIRYVGSKTKLLRKQRLISLVMKIVNSYGMQNLDLVKHYQPMI